MEKAGNLVRDTLDYIDRYVVEGVTTAHIDKLCHDYIVSHGGIPSTLGYHGFPGSICTSINHVVCHGIPSDRVLKRGDIINIDITAKLDGLHGDASRMWSIGRISARNQKLIDTTRTCLDLGIAQARPGNRLGDIGHAIQTHAEEAGFSVVRDFCGHGIGTEMHMSPQILHYGERGTGLLIEEGMHFTIEPMINAGKMGVKMLSDGWTVVTRDKKASAQWEHTLKITPQGAEILT